MELYQSLFSQEAINVFANSFHVLTRLHVGLHDIRREHCQASAGDHIRNLCKFCRNRCAEFYENCRTCDAEHLEAVYREKQPLVYTCHCGLTEVLIPVIDENTVTGVIFLGQARIIDDDMTDFERMFNRLLSVYPHSFHEDDRGALWEAYQNTTAITSEKLQALIDLTEISVRGLYLDRWIRGQAFSTEERFRLYLEESDLVHVPLSELSVKQVSEQLHMSYSQLNRLSASVTGYSFKQYVLHEKLQYAANLLLSNPNKKIGDIASSVGFDDICYFSRVFARKMGMSCMEYRKNNQVSS